MKSPFPGMDPYIEACDLWSDFQHDLISEIKNSLVSRMPERYVVRAGERCYTAAIDLDEFEGQKRAVLPDVSVVSRRQPARTGQKGKSSAASAAAQKPPTPVMMRALVKADFREPFLEILQTDPERKLVTGIEVLSPSNKRPGTKGWRLYNRKRRVYLNGRANFVELDLLRLGRRMPMISSCPDSPYFLLVCRKEGAALRRVTGIVRRAVAAHSDSATAAGCR